MHEKIIPKRCQPQTIWNNSPIPWISKKENETENRWFVWCFLWSSVSFEKWLSVAHASIRLSQMENRSWIFSNLEQTKRRYTKKSSRRPFKKKSVGEARIKLGRKDRTSFAIVDAQSVKNTDSTEEKGYDAGKKISGIKRHIAVDTNGFPHAITITTADVSDRDGALQMFRENKGTLKKVKKVLTDGGYRGETFSRHVRDLLRAKVEVVKRNELHRFVVLPKRWVVERSFGWFEKCRRLWKNCERKLNTSLQMVTLAFMRLLMKRYWTGSKKVLKGSTARKADRRSSNEKRSAIVPILWFFVQFLPTLATTLHAESKYFHPCA